MDRIRAELKRQVEANNDRDGRVATVQVAGTRAEGVEVRPAPDPGTPPDTGR